jgi:hypothetical protein
MRYRRLMGFRFAIAAAAAAGLAGGLMATALGTGSPAYAVRSGIVYLSGSLLTKDLLLVTTGDGWAFSNPASNAQQFTSLAGIAYPRNS